MLTEQYVKAETPFALGRPDAVIETPEYVYIMEYKIDQNPDAALTQIEERHYAASYISDSRKLLKVGINFSTKQRNIDAWKVV
ncbi:MAG: PD-(D/E)XK nuclease domain-containing protein [Paludibacteraceae bacterium]|nr:PD-(D/E)XK nuclease domain-containing protein [Paludibacteraceae bacterium]